jgi:hypothetical protein
MIILSDRLQAIFLRISFWFVTFIVQLVSLQKAIFIRIISSKKISNILHY